MKLRFYKRYTIKVLHFYAEELSRRFPDMFNIMTPANQVRLGAELQKIQNEQIAKEPQSDYWKAPVEIAVLPPAEDNGGRHILTCRFPEKWEQENVLYLDA